MADKLTDFVAAAAVPFLAFGISLMPMAILEWLEERPQRGRRRR